MAREAAESMQLYWIAGKEGHYLNNLCRAWSDALDDFRYTPLAETTKPAVAFKQVFIDHADLSGFDVYVAGPESFLKAAKKFLHESKLPENQLVTCRVE
jgi:CDP-4-dehydro-6-deoxyglucose reductase